jgi:hypothetical protein
VVLFGASASWADKVVLLEIDGDTSGKLRSQVELAVIKADAAEVLPLSAYKSLAAEKRLRGPAALEPAGIAKVGKTKKFDAAVSGRVSERTYSVVIYDFQGKELWTKELALKKGLLTPQVASKLARAIAAAAKLATSRPEGDAKDGAFTETAPKGQVAEGQSERERSPSDVQAAGADRGPARTETGDGTGEQSANGGSTNRSASGASTSEGRDRGDDASAVPDEPERDSDLDSESGRKRKSSARAAFGPKALRISLTGTTTWRSQCFRPGVDTCKEYETKKPSEGGLPIDFIPGFPYGGIGLQLEAFPLAQVDSLILQGFGLLGGFNIGWTTTEVTEQTVGGQQQVRRAATVDTGWSFQVAWRFHFRAGLGDPQPVGFVGVRGGLVARNFTIDAGAGTRLPSSKRVSPTSIGFAALGVDASVPIWSFLRADLGLQLFISPRPGRDQIAAFGNLNDPTGGVKSTGWGFEGGFSGDLWGPFGWILRLRYLEFKDRYYGQGQVWTACTETQCGGASEESFTSLYWGVTGAF